MNDGLNSQHSYSRYIVLCLIMVTFVGLLSGLFINYKLYQSRQIAREVSNSAQYSLSTLTPMLNEQREVIARIDKARSEANIGYAYVKKLLKELRASELDNKTTENLIPKAEQGASKIKSVRILIDESRRSTDEVGGNFNFMLDQLESLGRVKDINSSLNVVFTITVITMSLLTLVLFLGTIFIHHSLKRIKAASEQALRAKAKLEQSKVQQKAAELTRLLSGEYSIGRLTKSFLDFLAPELGIGVAAFYYLENDVLCFKQGYAYSGDTDKLYHFGEGIIGQVAEQRKAIELDKVPQGYIEITSGLGSINPKRILAIPVLKEQTDELQGVVEFGLLSSLSGYQHALLKESLKILTISINSAEYRENLNQLLRHSEQQTHQLAVASKEMEQQNYLLQLQKEEAERAKVELEINSQQLILARDEAQQATRTKSEFLAAMSHEIRTPMNGVLGMLQVLEDTGMSDEQAKHLNVITSSAESLLKIINDILDFSKIEAGKVELENVSFDLLQLAEGVVEQLYHSAVDKNLNLLLYFDQSVPQIVKGDPGRVRQILLNLIGNGIKFTHQGYVQLSIEKQLQLDGKENIVFKVTDTGIGIDEDKLDMVFQQFTQSDSSTSRQFGGTGLGLSISKSLTESMGGQMSVTSQSGQGSVFQFNILFDKQKNHNVFPVKYLQQLHILLVDSHEIRSKLLQSQLETWELNFSRAATVEQMMDCMQRCSREQSHYDLLLIDEDLVESAEIDFSLRENLPLIFQNVQLVMLQSMDKKAWGESAAPCFTKKLRNPVKPSDLLNVMTEAFEQTNPHHALVSSQAEDMPSSVVKPAAVVPIGQSDMNVLLVDDNKVNQNVAALMLKKLGITADIASNGEEAFAMLMQSPYDLVLMDCHMPVMDGYTASRKIRQSKHAFSDVYIIALTANAMEGDKDKCLDAGMNDYLAKPLRKDELAEKIKLAKTDKEKIIEV
ncbi:ATP-binding protein [Photobacterium sp. SDRW27]|uniref:response regulator n=1 Tax=Photobacterium obscurum TaxID=2829490 RepID=UPI002243CE3C|nr:response regulator [Photobacterium obscurum]MCW8327836.1 ATP-binding protein [Photobacterium obscurum]